MIFLNLIRWKNILIILLIFVLYQFCLFDKNITYNTPFFLYFSIYISCLLITAAGNILNDYLDKKMDLINKPNKIFVQHFSNNTLKLLYIIFNILGLFSGFYFYYITNNVQIFIIQFMCIFLLFIYSMYLKKIFLLGNVCIAILSATIFIYLYIFNFSLENNHPLIFKIYTKKDITLFYLFFSFYFSFLRELIKDMEDINGDKIYGCKTIPIVLGIPKTIIIFKFLLIVGILILNFIIVLNPLLLFNYKVLFFLFLCNYFVVKCFKIINNNQLIFSKISSYIKIIFLIGILSLIILKFP